MKKDDSALSWLAALVVSLALTGCATPFQAPTAFECTPPTGKTEIGKAKDCALQAVRFYRQQNTDSLDHNTMFFDLPLIATAVGTATSLIFDAADAYSMGFGIAGATIGGLRTYANLPAAAAVYLQGEVAAACIYDQADWFQRNAGTAGLLELSRDNVKKLRPAAEALIAQIENPNNSITATPDAVNALKAAVEASIPAESLASRAVAAFDTAGEVSRKELLSVDTKIRAKIQGERPKISDITATINSSISALKQAAAEEVKAAQKGAVASAGAFAAAGRMVAGSPTETAVNLARELVSKTEFISENASLFVERRQQISTCAAII